MTWQKTRIGSLCRKVTTRDPRRQPDAPFRYIDISGIDREQKIIASSTEITGTDAPSRARQVVLAGDVLVSTVRPNLNAVAMVPPGLDDEIASTGFCVLRAAEDLVLPKFLFHFTRTDAFINALLQHVRGANYPAVTDRNVLNVEIPWPCITEQRRIVEILDKADTLRQQRRAAGEKSQRILPALFYHMFGDPLTNPRGWPVVSVGNVVPSITAGVSVGGESRCLAPGEKGVLKISAVTSGEFLPDEFKAVSQEQLPTRTLVYPKQGDLLMSRANTRELVGATCLVRQDCDRLFLPDKIWRLDVDEARVTRTYLKSLFSDPRFRPSIGAIATGTSGSMLNISQRKLQDLSVPLPDIALQREFSRSAQCLQETRDGAREATANANALHQLILHRAFTGDLTANWREAHREELEAEMQVQAKALAVPAPRSSGRGRKRRVS